MTRSNLDGAGTELRINCGICDDWNLAANQRQLNHPADQILEALVVRINCDGAIAQHCFRPCCSNGYVSRAVEQRVSNVPEVAFKFFMLNFDMRQRRFTARTPVDQPVITLDQPLIVELHEYFRHGSRETLVKRKALTAPVA